MMECTWKRIFASAHETDDGREMWQVRILSKETPDEFPEISDGIKYMPDGIRIAPDSELWVLSEGKTYIARDGGREWAEGPSWEIGG